MRIRIAWVYAASGKCRSGDASGNGTDGDTKKNDRSGCESGRHEPRQTVVQRTVEVPAGATIAQALDALGPSGPAGWRERVADGRLALAVFGRPGALTTVLHDDDRVELVGPLSIDPKAARRQRAQRRRDGSGDGRWRRRGGPG